MRKQFGKVRMSSVEMHHNSSFDKSGSPSPCRSPIVNQKPQRLLPANLYVALYNFLSRHEDEISLKAGSTITVTDTCGECWQFVKFKNWQIEFENGCSRNVTVETFNLKASGKISANEFLFSALNNRFTLSTDPDWWVGKSYGSIGYFPSKYVAKLYPGNRVRTNCFDSKIPISFLQFF